MPVGVDTKHFFPNQQVRAQPNSILFLSGMWPSKRPEILIGALSILDQKGIDFKADFYGSPLPETQSYYESIKKIVIDKNIADHVTFYGGVPNNKTPDIYRAHAIFVNCSPSGMFDKTLFEAAACGCKVLSSSKDFAALTGPETYFDSAAELAERLTSALAFPNPSNHKELVEHNSLPFLIEELVKML
jgi:glycosyltransferase involved in cell wall biosynthesis